MLILVRFVVEDKTGSSLLLFCNSPSTVGKTLALPLLEITAVVERLHFR